MSSLIKRILNELFPEPPPPPAKPSPEDVVWETQFQMKQLVKKVDKSIAELEADIRTEFGDVQRLLKEGDTQGARAGAAAVAKFKSEVAKLRNSRATIKVMYHKTKTGAFSAEAVELIGKMSTAILQTSNPSDINKELSKVMKCEEISNLIGEQLQENMMGDDPDLNAATEQIMIQAGMGVATDPSLNTSPVSDKGIAETGENKTSAPANIQEEADQGLKELSDLINGKK